MKDRSPDQNLQKLHSNSKKFVNLYQDKFLIMRPKQASNFLKDALTARQSADQKVKISRDNSIKNRAT